MTHNRKTIFLDRDGVINVDSADYIKTPEEFSFIPESPEGVALLSRNGFDVIVITNQSLIGRKMATPETLDAIFKKMTSGIENAGGCIKDIFFCPHTPQAGCDCRKPSPGMILAAFKKYQIQPGQSLMVGDSVKDIECARRAGCQTNILVQTGNGTSALKQLQKQNIQPGHIARNLYSAAQWIISHF